MNRKKDIQDWLLLNYLLCGSTVRASARLSEGFSAAEVLEKMRSEASGEELENLRRKEGAFNPAAELDACVGKGVDLLTLEDEDYPPLLRQIAGPPPVLYVRGRIEPCDAAAIAVVGTRHPSLYGRRHAQAFANELAEAGWTVVSGLARGVDQSAHEGALIPSYGRTLAVLGSGVDHIYPAENRRLSEKIIERGAVISEYPLGAAPLAHHFPKRNRIISGLALGTLVIEANLKSGSLITARLALEQGREVFALPGNIDSVTSQGGHRLIREGAMLADSASVIMETLSLWTSSVIRPVRGKEALPDEGEKEPPADSSPVLEELRREGPLSAEELTGLAGMPVSLLPELLKLEISGRIRKRADGRYHVDESA